MVTGQTTANAPLLYLSCPSVTSYNSRSPAVSDATTPPCSACGSHTTTTSFSTTRITVGIERVTPCRPSGRAGCVATVARAQISPHPKRRLFCRPERNMTTTGLCGETRNDSSCFLRLESSRRAWTEAEKHSSSPSHHVLPKDCRRIRADRRLLPG